MWTLYRQRPFTRQNATYSIPFDLENTCLCIDGWDKLGISSAAISQARGMEFARNVKRLAFVFTDGTIINKRLGSILQDDSDFAGLHGLALLFHNTRHVSAITQSAHRISSLLKDDAFLPLFSFQPFIQKTMVQGVALTKTRAERYRLLDEALVPVFTGWKDRIKSALTQTGLLNILSEIREARGRSDPVPHALRAIGVDYDMVLPLIQQAISNGQLI